MGAAFSELSPAVHQFHSSAGRVAFDGWAETAAPQTRVARWIARRLGTPQQQGRHAIRFELDARPDAETWTRYFPGRTMRSRMGLRSGDLVEQLGPLRLHFSLTAQEGALVMQLRRVRCFGVSCPRWLMPHGWAAEAEEIVAAIERNAPEQPADKIGLARERNCGIARQPIAFIGVKQLAPDLPAQRFLEQDVRDLLEGSAQAEPACIDRQRGDVASEQIDIEHLITSAEIVAPYPDAGQRLARADDAA
jgi:hypothetical protein